jgi:2'-5' RNA ligase
MVHSIELLLDADSEAAVRRVWKALSEAGLRAPAPTSRPHATLVVADGISPEVGEPLSSSLRRLPLPCVIGAPMVFGRSPFVLVRVVVPSVELLELQAEVARICQPYLTHGAASNTAVGQWTPHVTLARRVDSAQLSKALSIRSMTRDIRGSVVGLRRWDGNKRIEYLIS